MRSTLKHHAVLCYVIHQYHINDLKTVILICIPLPSVYILELIYKFYSETEFEMLLFPD